MRQHRSIQDEKLLLSIFSTSEAPPTSLSPEPEYDRQAVEEDEAIARVDRDDRSKVYGAQQHNLIVDARPTVNAFAMQAVGMGSENMDNYKFATKIYLGIDNIHVMRDSLNKVIDTLKDSDLTPLRPSREGLARSHWLRHIGGVLDGTGIIVRQLALQHSHVLIHCSDGWDRTSQLSALSQLCLDPFFRTLEGFITLIEKDWLSFGHQFGLRSGFLSSEKWFGVENEKPESLQNPSGLESALQSAKGFFNKDHRDDSDGEMQNYDNGSPVSKKWSARSDGEKSPTKVKETSPIFHQFLDATYQLLHQHPSRFEFNERFLRRLLYHLYSCQYGSFLYNNERERREAKVSDKTRAVWDYFLSRKSQFLNDRYDPVVDDHVRGRERLILPHACTGGDGLRWWNELFGRTDEEMNGSIPTPQATTTLRDSVLNGVESAHGIIESAASPQPEVAMVSSTRKLDLGHDTP